MGFGTKIIKNITRYRRFKGNSVKQAMVYSHENCFWDFAVVICRRGNVSSRKVHSFRSINVKTRNNDPSYSLPHSNLFGRRKNDGGGEEKKRHNWFTGITLKFLLGKKICISSFVRVLKPMVDKTEVLHHKFPFGHSVLRTCIQQPYHFEVKSQSLMESASFSHTEISFDSFSQTYFEKQHAHTVNWSIKAIDAVDEACGLAYWA